jgi:YidC/Oxa1 family membrane protein insertase
MDTRRIILFVILSFSIMMLWDAWQRKEAPPVEQSATASAVSNVANSSAVTNTEAPQADGKFKLDNGQRIHVTTDIFDAVIDTNGGDLRRLVLLKHLADGGSKDPLVLMSDAADPLLYVAQTGLKGDGLPTHRSVFTASNTEYKMQEGADKLEVRLSTTADNGVVVDKVYTFHRDNYAIDVNYEIKNNSANPITPSVYYQIVHDNQSNQGSMLMPTFTGGAYYNEELKYKKLKFEDMQKSDLALKSKDGWVGLVQHYFVSAWIPQDGLERKFYTKELSANDYSIGSISPLATVAAGASATIPARLYAGPQKQSYLVETAPGLEYTVDYGWLTVIAKPLFWLLSKMYDLAHNWGVAIILVTVLLKAAFYRLSASSYKSMAQMRELAPRLQSMKEKFGDDKQKMQQAMMEMYKTEKINPLGGCLPILVQIPVFIAFYWMLLGSVELRHAPFFGWIQDLSAKDPLYILPILMGASMIVQSFISPAPTDPMQAKMMKIMPVVFSIFFFFFPAGLVLYWLVNNILSITQQWFINKSIHAAALAKKGNAKK